MKTKAIPMPKLTEKVWQSQVVALAKTFGYRAYHPFLSKWSEKGWPDLVLLHVERKRLIFVELKTETGKLTPSQEEWISALSRAGQEVYVWRPSDWDEAARILAPGGMR